LNQHALVEAVETLGLAMGALQLDERALGTEVRNIGAEHSRLLDDRDVLGALKASPALIVTAFKRDCPRQQRQYGALIAGLLLSHVVSSVWRVARSLATEAGPLSLKHRPMSVLRRATAAAPAGARVLTCLTWQRGGGGRHLRARCVEVSSAVGTEVDGMPELGGSCSGTEPAKAPGALSAFQIPEAAAQDHDSNNSADCTSEDIADRDRHYRNYRNGSPDGAHPQCTAPAVLEIGTDCFRRGPCLIHGPQCYALRLRAAA